MLNLSANVIRKLAKAKIYLQRGSWYSSALSQLLVLRIFLKGAGYPQMWIFISAAAGALAVMLLLMFIEDRLGFWRMETELHWSRSPQLKRILDAVEEKP